MTTSVDTQSRPATRVGGWRSSRKARSRVTLAIKYVVAALVLTFSLFPIIWTISVRLAR